MTDDRPMTGTLIDLDAARAERQRPSGRQGSRVILALDLGTKTGWAVRSAGGHVSSGSQDLKPRRFEGGGMRFLRFRGWLNELASTGGRPAALYFEEVRRHAGVDAAHVYGGLLTTLTWQMERWARSVYNEPAP